MKQYIFIIATVLLITGFACKQASEETTETTPATEQPQQQPSATTGGHVQLGDNLSATTPAATSPSGGLGSINIEAMRELWEQCDGIDIIFYKTNFSLSQNEKAAIQNTIGFFGPTYVEHNKDCKPVGRITFLIKGEIRREADIYIDQGCQYFLWMENNKPVYINPMSPQGVTFFEQIIKKGQSAF